MICCLFPSQRHKYNNNKWRVRSGDFTHIKIVVSPFINDSKCNDSFKIFGLFARKCTYENNILLIITYKRGFWVIFMLHVFVHECHKFAGWLVHDS